jgi:hypothetical protein
VPYRPDFQFNEAKYGKNYFGASLPAFIKLLKQKGYRYVGSQSLGFNAFFIRDGIGENLLPEVAVEDIFKQAKVMYSTKGRVEQVRHLPWIEV